MKTNATSLKTDLYNVFVSGNASTVQFLRVFTAITTVIAALCLFSNHII